MTRPSWDKELLNGPVGMTIDGPGKRSFADLISIASSIDEANLDDKMLWSPHVFYSSLHMCATEFYRHRREAIADAQMVALKRFTPKGVVPPFDRNKAAGEPGHWNYFEPKVMKGKGQEFVPDLTEGTGDIRKFQEFLRMRPDEDGKPCSDLFEEPLVRVRG